MSLLIPRVIETVEHVDIWDILDDPEQLEELCSGDEVKMDELARRRMDRERLQYQCNELKVIFPNRDKYYDDQLNLQISDLEKQIKALLPNLNFIS